jgi:hypothetical protein
MLGLIVPPKNSRPHRRDWPSARTSRDDSWHCRKNARGFRGTTCSIRDHVAGAPYGLRWLYPEHFCTVRTAGALWNRVEVGQGGIIGVRREGAGASWRKIAIRRIFDAERIGRRLTPKGKMFPDDFQTAAATCWRNVSCTSLRHCDRGVGWVDGRLVEDPAGDVHDLRGPLGRGARRTGGRTSHRTDCTAGLGRTTFRIATRNRISAP